MEKEKCYIAFPKAGTFTEKDLERLKKEAEEAFGYEVIVSPYFNADCPDFSQKIQECLNKIEGCKHIYYPKQYDIAGFGMRLELEKARELGLQEILSVN